MEAIAFYLFSALTIAMFTIVVVSDNALYAMSALAGGMIFIAGFFFLLDAEFLGVVQIIVYTGAVMALYAFGMMFFDTTRAVKENVENKYVLNTLAGLATVFAVVAVTAPFAGEHVGYVLEAVAPIIDGVGNSQMVGYVLFTKYLVPFELAAIMLLVAMIAGIVLVSKTMDKNITMLEAEVQEEAEKDYKKDKIWI